MFFEGDFIFFVLYEVLLALSQNCENWLFLALSALSSTRVIDVQLSDSCFVVWIAADGPRCQRNSIDPKKHRQENCNVSKWYSLVDPFFQPISA
jgi:hypothetical protein